MSKHGLFENQQYSSYRRYDDCTKLTSAAYFLVWQKSPSPPHVLHVLLHLLLTGGQNIFPNKFLGLFLNKKRQFVN